MRSFTIGDASRLDVEGLIRLEDASFRSDRISARGLRRLVAAPGASVRVVRLPGGIAGSAVVLFRKGSSVARLYSVAVDKALRGRGLGRALIADAEKVARRRGMTVLRLEVREDNTSAIRLYKTLGFRPIGIRRDYYADGATALRFEKRLQGRIMAPSPSLNERAPVREDRESHG